MSCYSFTRWVNAFVNSIIQVSDTLPKSTPPGTLMRRPVGGLHENQCLTSPLMGAPWKYSKEWDLDRIAKKNNFKCVL